jgi:branched-chain amino acid transport system permease protein
VAVGAALSAGAERLIIRRIPDRSGMTVVSATVGLLLLINGFSERVWRGVVRGFPSAFPNRPQQYVFLADARLRYTTIGTWLILLAVLGALWLVLRYTKVGLAFRAVSSSTEMSELMGIHAGRITTLGWALAGGIGALAGCLVAPTVLLEPGMMVRVLIFALVAATLGGLDSLGGAVLGGLLIGVTQTMLGGYVPFIGSQLSLPAALLVMVLILCFRPTGLFGTRRVERV